MTSKEALEKLLEMAIENGLWKSGLVEDLENTIKQDLDKLEQLEQENKELLIALENKNNEIKFLKTLINDNKLKKAIKILSNYICVRNPLDEEDTYYLSALFSNEEIDKQTHNLLKEALENEL